MQKRIKQLIRKKRLLNKNPVKSTRLKLINGL